MILYGCETWFLTLREEHKLRVFEDGAEENIWAEEGEVIGGWRKLHNEELHNLYDLPSIIRSRRMRWPGHVAPVGRIGMHTRFWWENRKERDL
jgi:hypothetical protein